LVDIHVDRHNEDGSYTYGYEAADGTFKLETRFPDGSVQGTNSSVTQRKKSTKQCTHNTKFVHKYKVQS
jgi:hypothetical protein